MEPKTLKTITRLHKEELAKAHQYNPEFNVKAISIIEQPDGNWIGTIQKAGKVLYARQSNPQIVLQLLLTHPGTKEVIS